MRVLHERDGTTRTLASDVETADSTLSQARGLMFRRSIPEDYALVFRFDDVGNRSLHMLFVPFPIDAVWLVDDEVRKVRRLRAWLGLDWGSDADTVVELPAGAADGVSEGDELRVVE